MNYIASDHAGFILKSFLVKKFPLTDTGCHSTERCDYPTIVKTLTEKITSSDKAIIVCGSGCGV